MVSTITQTYLTQQMLLKGSTVYSVLSDNIISTFAPVAMALSNWDFACTRPSRKTMQ